ncbi:MAG: DMT family transporter [Waddliaceae bacterium]
MIWIVVLYALFASIFTVAKTGLEYTQPLFFVGFRMVIAGVMLLSYQYFVDRSIFKQIRKHLLPLALLAIFNIYLANVLEFWGLQYLTSFKTCFIYGLSPFASAILSYFTFSETLSRKKIIGLVIGCLGFLPILLQKGGPEETVGELFFISWAELSVMGGAFCAVYGWILLRKLVSKGEMSTFLANGFSMFVGGIISLTHSYFVENWQPVPVTSWQPFLECTFFMIIVSSFICYNLSGYLLKRYTATFFSFAGFITPLFSALFGWWFLNEQVGLPFYLSFIGVFAGLSVFYQEELREGFISRQQVLET